MTLLDDGPEVYTVPEDDEGRRTFRIDGPGLAAWGVLKVARLDEADADDEAAAKEHIQAWQQWLAERKAARQKSREFFEHHLERYALQVREETGEREKNVTTPYGRITTRTVPERWEADERTLIAWAEQNQPKLIGWRSPAPKRVVSMDAAHELLDVTDLGLVDRESGALVEGLRVIPEHIKATVKPDLGGAR